MQSPFFLETFSLPDEIQELKLPCAQQRQQQNAGSFPFDKLRVRMTEQLFPKNEEWRRR
jgi:hypothetical protein